MTQAPNAADHIDTMAYAVALFNGAERIAATDRTQKIELIGIPFFLLIGFSLENALKAMLKSKQDARTGWKHSHDLNHLHELCIEHGLEIENTASKIISLLSPYHKGFWFRYPEKAETADVWSAASTLFATDAVLKAVYRATNIDHRSISPHSSTDAS